LLVLLVAGVISFLLSRTLTRPLARLVAGTHALTAGNLDTKIEVTHNDEVGQLSHSFNEMAGAIQRREAALQELTASLEQRVKDRTADLQTANKQLQQEIIERERAEQELVRLASFPKLNPSLIIEIDLEGHIHYLNPAALALFPELQTSWVRHPILTKLQTITCKAKTKALLPMN